MKEKYLILFLALFLLNGCADFSDLFGPGGARTSQSAQKNVKQKYRVYKVKHHDTLKGISKKFMVSSDELLDINNFSDASEIKPGIKIYIPNKKIQLHENSKVTAIEPVKKSSKRFIWPTQGHVSSNFGARGGRPHDGIDIPGALGSPIHAAMDGKVIYAGRLSAYGNLIIIKHKSNLFTAYAHLSKMIMKKGTSVKQGQKIGEMGRTGRATANHLHFEIREKAKPVDPLLYLPKR